MRITKLPLISCCVFSKCLARLLAAYAVVAFPLAAWKADAGPIVYVKPDVNGVSQLWQINPDGSGNRLLNVNLPQPDRPVWSHNGRVLAVTSNDPGRPNKLSTNVYGIDAISGQIQQLTFFEDMVELDPTRSSYSLPLFKALSPDNARLAVSRIVRVGVTTAISATPFLQTFRTADGLPLNLLNAGSQLDGLNAPGAGVDWSPVSDLLVHPTTVLTQSIGGTDFGYVTSLALFDANAGLLEQLTFPQTEFMRSFFPARLVVWWENDYQPAFSPNGQQIAYFRSRETVESGDIVLFQRYLSDVSLHVVNADGTNDHIVCDFNPGLIPQQVSWSPDGSQLVFDLGQELIVGGTPMALPDPATTQTLIVNADGSNLRLLVSAPALFPTWSPTIIGRAGDLNADGQINNLDIFPFALALTDPTQFAIQFPAVNAGAAGDINTDGTLNNLDIAPFANLLVGATTLPAPEPQAAILALLGLAALAAPRLLRAAMRHRRSVKTFRCARRGYGIN